MACNSQSGLMQLGCCGGPANYENRRLRAQIGSSYLTGASPDYYSKYLLCRDFAENYDISIIPANNERIVLLNGDGVEISSSDASLTSPLGIAVADLIFFQASDSSTRRVLSDKFMRIGPSPQPSKIIHDYKSGCDTRYTDYVFQPDIIPSFAGVPISHLDDVTYNVLDPSCTVIP